jgi:hypothetical protein
MNESLSYLFTSNIWDWDADISPWFDLIVGIIDIGWHLCKTMIQLNNQTKFDFNNWVIK